jgi:D-serine dehydratase
MNDPKRAWPVPEAVRAGIPTVWRNPMARPASEVLPTLRLQWSDLQAAQARWRRFAPLLAHLFPELKASGGEVDSPLLEPKGSFARAVLGGVGRLLIKADHDLPVTGCIKARGGVHEVLWYAERIAASCGRPEDFAAFAEPAWRERFARHTVVVGSTGNLGYSVGVMARSLGFAAEVHMSNDAKAWKKDRLRRIDANVVEHQADYTAAVAAARSSAATRAECHFVDDETSEQLFLGYGTGAMNLRAQIDAAGIAVDAARAESLSVSSMCSVTQCAASSWNRWNHRACWCSSRRAPVNRSRYTTSVAATGPCRMDWPWRQPHCSQRGWCGISSMPWSP